MLRFNVCSPLKENLILRERFLADCISSLILEKDVCGEGRLNLQSLILSL